MTFPTPESQQAALKQYSRDEILAMATDWDHEAANTAAEYDGPDDPLKPVIDLAVERAKTTAAMLRQIAAPVDHAALAQKLAGYWTDTLAHIEAGKKPPDMMSKTVDEVCAALRAAGIGAGVVEGWRPIETAPKDGTPFIAYSPMHGVYANVSWGRYQRFDPNGHSSLMSNWTHWMPQPKIDPTTPHAGKSE